MSGDVKMKCGKGHEFTASELRTGTCPWEGCFSRDLYVEDDDGNPKKYVGNHFKSGPDRMVRHER